MKGFTHAVHNIQCLKRFDLPGIAFDKVLILDYVTIKEVKGIIRAKKILIISEKYTDNPEYFLSHSLYNVEYYGEMPFHYKDYQYRMKCLFKRYKKLENVQKGTFINAPRVEDFTEVMNNIGDLIYLPQPFIFKSKTKPEDNLFEQFTHYLYYHADKWFDPHPRLFLECRFYDKIMTYKNPYKVHDGSWHRWGDLYEKGLWQRTLSKDDEIIRQLI